MAIRHCSLTTHSSISVLLFHGIATPGIPVLSFRSSVVIVKAGDVVAKFALSGCCFAQATSSPTVFDGLLTGTDMISGSWRSSRAG